MSVVSDVEIRLRADIARLRQDLQDARREVTGALGSMGAAAEAFKGVLGGIAAGLSVGAFAAFVKQSIDAADALNDLSVRSKVAIEDLAGLAYAAKLGDTSLDGVAGSITKLGQNIGKEGAKFRALGITATEPLEAFKQLADVFKNIQDPQQRAAFGAEALGKSWQEAAVLLDGGSQGITDLIERGKELSGVTTQVAADAGAFNDKIDELTFAAQGAGTRIAAGLLPTLQKIADSFSADSVNGDKFAGTVTVLSASLKGLYSVGVGVVALFTGLGKSIGGTAAVAVAALSGDFKGALDIYKAMAADVYTGLGDAAIQIAKVWVDTGKEVVETAKVTDQAVDNSAKVTAFLAGTQAKAAASAEKIAAEAAKWAAKTISDGNKRIVLATAEMESTTELTAEQKKLLDVFADLVKYSAYLEDEQKQRIADNGEEALFLERLTAARKADKKAQEDAEDAAKRDTDAAWDKVRSLQEQVKTYGLTEDAIGRLKVAEYQRQLGATELSEVEQSRLTSLLAATEEQIKLQEKLGTMKAETTFWEGLDSTAHATFVSIANGGKDAATRLKDTFKNVFFDWLYQQTIKKWIINIGTSTTESGASVASSVASLFGGGSSGGSGAGGILGTASNWLSIGKTIYSGFTGGVSASLGSAISSMGTTFGNSAVSAFGAGMQGGEAAFSAAAAGGNSAAIGAGSSAAAAIPIIGWIIAGMQAADGFRKQGFTANNGTINNPILQAAALPTNFAEKTMKAIGFNDAIANILSGAAINTKLFGRADPRVEAQGLRGTVSAAGFDADNYAKIIEKGGIFRSSKRYEKSADLDAATDKAWDETIANMITSVKGFGSALGIQTSVIDGYAKSFDIKLTGKAEEDNAAIAKLFGDVGDELSLRLVPGLAAFAKEGETMSATLQRLAVNYQSVDKILSATGQSIKQTGVAGIQAREDLIAAAGGIEQLSSGVSYFQQNWLSDTEKLTLAQAQLSTAMGAIGQAAVTTNEQFKAAVLGIDLGTKAGAELYVQMLALAPAFKEVTDATTAAASAAAQQAKAVADALATTNQGYDDQIDALLAARAGAEAVRALEIRGMDASTVARYDYLKALQAEDAAMSAAAQAAREQEEATKAADKGYKDQIDQILKARMSAAEVYALETAGMAASTKALYDRLAALKADTAASEAAKAAAAAQPALLKEQVTKAYASLEASINAQKNVAASALSSLMAGFDSAIAASASKMEGLRSVVDALRSADTSMGQDQTMNRLAGQAAIQTAIALARTGGVFPSADAISKAVAAASKSDASDFSTAADFRRDQLLTANSIIELGGLADTQLSVEEHALETLRAQQNIAQAAFDGESMRLDSLLATSKNQVDVLNGINLGIATIPEALNALGRALAAAAANPTVAADSATGQVEALYTTLLGRRSDAAGLSFWTDALKNGVSIEQIRKDFQNSPEYQRMQAEARTAMVPTTPGIYSPQQSGTMQSDAMLLELQTLNARIVTMEANIARTANSNATIAGATGQFAREFSTVSNNGSALLVEA